MSLAKEHLRALIESEKLPGELPPGEAARVLTDLLTKTQQLTLSQLNSSAARQLGSILFSHEAGLVSAFATINPPVIKRDGKGAILSAGLILACFALVIALFSAYLVWDADLYFLSIVFAISAVLALIAYFLPRKSGSARAEQYVDMKALCDLALRRMEVLDRDLEAFLNISPDVRPTDDSVVNIIMQAMSLKKQDPTSVPDELMTSITALSIANGYSFVDYEPETEEYFDVMPTKRETRTITPAVFKDNTLIAKGTAVAGLRTSVGENR